jgi:Rps23 Pro-64 3,4-dihydroxylase Tpa1-like proline 4-hydroxylase
MSEMSNMSETSVSQTANENSRYFHYDRYESQQAVLAQSYQEKRPYHHLYFEGFLDDDLALAMSREFPRHSGQAWTEYKHVNENKAGIHVRDKLPEQIGKVVDELNSPRFVALLSRITGLEGLLADDLIEGGGIHQAEAGGFLNVHSDFTMHRTRPNWRRRCNLIIYLNEGWKEEWGGNLDFWEPDMSATVASYPTFLNTAVLFDTLGTLHGFPDPLTCPETVARKSVQFYYYTIDDSQSSVARATAYHARPSDRPAKSLLIALDNRALAVYSWVKRRFGLSDEVISKLLRFFGRGSR